MSDSAQPSILVVDDEPDICRNLVDIFSDFGYRVEMAFDGPSALALVRKQRFDIALLDLMMPGMDGASLYAEIKKLNSGTVAIIITAYPGHPRAEAARDAGVWRLLPKPIDFPPLIGSIEEALGQPLVLVVDDDADFCWSLWDVLREHGYRACIANDVAIATARIKDQNYSVVLLDMKLPDGDRSSVFQEVRRINPDTRVVVVTGFPVEMKLKLQQLQSERGQTVLGKPLDVLALLATLRDIAHAR
jgi:DNA-binding NtrC family response regulator